MPKAPQKIAVVLFNLGGPKTQQDVRPFLRNLFSDPAIIGLPFGIRHVLAEVISRRRETQACANYQLMDGGSPIVYETQKQQIALQKALEKSQPKINWLCVAAMRYWHPRASAILEQVQKFGPDQVILLPLYPQFSTTTTGSSFNEWNKLSAGSNWKTSQIISYETSKLFISAHVAKSIGKWEQAGKPKNIRVLFSAHGLPEKIIQAGDPYQQQIEASASLIAKQLPKQLSDWGISYQSRVGPLRWIGPSTIEEITRAGADGKNLLIIPISFVSEHIETLVELDIEYAELAKQVGIGLYLRVEALRDDPLFIACLAEQIKIKQNEC